MIRLYRVGGATVVAALAGWALMASPSVAASDDKDNWDAMRTCATLDDAAARHVCTDAVLRSAGLLNPAAPRTAQDTPTKPEARPKVAQQPAAPRQAETLSQTERQAFYPDEPAPKTEDAQKAEDIGRIKVTLAKARRTGDGRLILTATDGVTWRQLYRRGSMPIPKSGSSMSVRKGVMNGYMCSIDMAPTFRCEPQS